MNVSHHHLRYFLLKGERRGLFQYGRSKKFLKDRKKKLLKVKKLYDDLGITAAGKRLGLSRQRVQQLLEKGQKLNLFKHKSRRESLDEIYRQTVDKIANKLDPKGLERLMIRYGTEGCRQYFQTKYGLRKVDFEQLLQKCRPDRARIQRERIKKRWAAAKFEIRKEYEKFVSRLGHHPSTPEMFADPKFKKFGLRIGRYWGSYSNFRKELGLPIINMRINMHNNPKIIAFLQRLKEDRNKKLALIYEFIRKNKGTTSKQISDSLGLNLPAVRRCLKEIIEKGKIKYVRYNKARMYYAK